MNQDAVRLGAAPLNRNRSPRPEAADLDRAEAGLSALLEAWQRAIEELGAMVPPAQVRALLTIDAEDDLNVTGLARQLGTSPSAASRLCHRLAAAGLLARLPAWPAAGRPCSSDRVRAAARRPGSVSSGGRR